MASTLGVYNPLRYRGYVYDTETGLYYLTSRYYNPSWCRFINADGELAGVGGDIQGSNLFNYCLNNPVNMADPTGQWSKWLFGALNIASGALQIAAGAALGATAGWTGIGAVAAVFLVANGTATITQGAGQIINSVSGTNIMREDNIIKSSVQSIGGAIGGDNGAQVAGVVYDVAVAAANICAGGAAAKDALQQARKILVTVKVTDLIPDPTNPMTAEGINYWTKTLAQNGFKGYNTLPNAYGAVEPIYVQMGTMMIANGHHRVAVLAKYGIETIKVFLVP